MIRKVISGGQTGADQGALEGARLAGVATGGAAPMGWKTESGPAKELLQSYNLKETNSPNYVVRTGFNAYNADGTLIICKPPTSGGSRLTRDFCINYGKPYYCYAWPLGPEDFDLGVRTIANWIFTNEIRVLNVAGNRESKNPGIQSATCRLVLQLCGAVNG